MNITYEDQAKERLDKFLVAQLPNTSRSQLQKMIKDGVILLNGETTAVHTFLKPGDQIVVGQALKTEQTIIEPTVIAETPNYLILNKPAGLVVYATDVKNYTLIDWLKKNYPKLKAVGEEEQPYGLVHRLDKEVSGVLVIAKTQKFWENLKYQFADHTIYKEYLGFANGAFPDKAGVIDLPLIRTKAGIIGAVAKNQEGKDAITEYEVIEQYKDYTLLKIIIKTGRTHQIRAHLKAFNHPLVGDKLYNSKDKLLSGRVFLHAAKLSFTDPKGEIVTFTAPLPEELQTIVDRFKK
ncbi:MAG: RluA family pseudouridine synthase [Candidatus Komeilibacteria bacterium]|nr:RluA family pseudouridine synthase [Candidatus Komeilibacteria bacterium]